MKASIGELSIDFPNKQRIKPELKPSSGEIHEVSAPKCFDETTIFCAIWTQLMMVADHVRDLTLPRASRSLVEIPPGESHRWLEIIKGLVKPDSEVMEHCGNGDLAIAIRRPTSEDSTIVEHTVYVPALCRVIRLESVSPPRQ